MCSLALRLWVAWLPPNKGGVSIGMLVAGTLANLGLSPCSNFELSRCWLTRHPPWDWVNFSYKIIDLWATLLSFIRTLSCPLLSSPAVIAGSFLTPCPGSSYLNSLWALPSARYCATLIWSRGLALFPRPTSIGVLCTQFNLIYWWSVR